jgi:hypothetical protein
MIPKGKLLIIGGHEDKGEIAGENLIIYKRKKTETRFEVLGTLIYCVRIFDTGRNGRTLYKLL